MRVCLALAFLLFSSAVELNGQIDVIASEYYETIIDNTKYRLPYFSNKSLAAANPDVTKIIVVVHGTNRNADDYFETMEDALFQRPEQIRQTLIVAPQFLTEEDIDAFNLSRDFPYWTSDGWKVGSNSQSSNSNPRSDRVPSYELLDSMITSLSRTFTSVEELAFTGHSAGGQLTNRYTASTPVFSTLCSDFDISTKSIIANPGSYVYMSPMRREGDNTEFSIPTNCAEYNEYSYGLEDLYTYHRRVGADNMKAMYAEREVIYLFGSLDNDPEASTLPRSCRAMLQGDHRLERGLNYYDHIVETFGNDIKTMHQLEIIEGVGHNNYDMYNHPIGLKYLFDEPPINTCRQTTSTQEANFQSILIYPNPAHSIIKVTREIQVEALSLYNINGQKIGDTDQNEMDISLYKPGVYFLRIVSHQPLPIQKVIITQ